MKYQVRLLNYERFDSEDGRSRVYEDLPEAKRYAEDLVVTAFAACRIRTTVVIEHETQGAYGPFWYPMLRYQANLSVSDT